MRKKGVNIRIISARKAAKSEERTYTGERR